MWEAVVKLCSESRVARLKGKCLDFWLQKEDYYSGRTTCDTLVWATRTLVEAACHTILDGVGVVAFRVNLVKNVIEGVYNTISVVSLIVYINVKMIKYIPLYIMWL